MDFCDLCSNTMTLSLSENTDRVSVHKKCLACGSKRDLPKGCHLLFERLGTSAALQTYEQYVNDTIFKDPTVARMSLDCPNCQRSASVRYIRFGNGLDYLYACEECRTFWTRTRGSDALQIVSGAR